VSLVLALDTATPSTAVAVLDGARPGDAVERRHDPAPEERPAHATRLLALCEQALGAAGAGWDHVDLLAAGIGPGGFTGLRIGLATAHGLALARGLPLAGVSSLAALAHGAREGAPGGRVAAVLDARRGEAFAAAFDGPRETMPAAALAPDALAGGLAALSRPRLAVGDGALRFAELIEGAGLEVPDGESPLHRVRATSVARLALEALPGAAAEVLPDYLRRPDAALEASRRERA